MATLTSQVEGLLIQARAMDAYLAKNNISAPSINEDTLAGLPLEVQDMRSKLATDIGAFQALIAGPVMSVMSRAMQWISILALRVIIEFDIPKAVPLEGSATYAEIAAKCGLAENMTRRFLHHAMTAYVFQEVDGKVRHTATSYAMATQPEFCDGITLQTSEFAPAANHVIQAWKQYGQDATDPKKTAWALANNTDLPLYTAIGKDPTRAKRFGNAMKFYTRDDPWDLRYLLNAFDWASLDKPGCRIVDVGGGFGQVSQFIARSTKHIQFTVQDLPQVINTVEVPSDLVGRFNYVVQDFLQPQQDTTPVDAFVIRWILHNWCNDAAAQILRNLIPALKPGSKILIHENVLDDSPEYDVPGRFGAPQLDIIMMVAFNALERTAQQFKQLLAKADPRFEFVGVRKPPGSSMSLVEVTWNP